MGCLRVAVLGWESGPGMGAMMTKMHSHNTDSSVVQRVLRGLCPVPMALWGGEGHSVR